MSKEKKTEPMPGGYRPRNRPRALGGRTIRELTGCGKIYVTVNHDEVGLFEVFAHLGKAGQCGAAQIEAICRSVSVGLRSGMDATVFIKQFLGIQCPLPYMFPEADRTLSCADAIAKALRRELEYREGLKKGREERSDMELEKTGPK
jgi:ribonucleoside-diphosphate reductase alpha chain